MPTLTHAQRRATCIHEAGHAVAFALGGVSVHRLAVADEGAAAWRTDIRNGRMCTGLWGLCEKADLVLPRQFLRWLMNEGCLHPDGRGHPQLLQRPEGRAQVEGFCARLQREILAQMVGLMAGPAAEQIFRGEAVRLALSRRSRRSNQVVFGGAGRCSATRAAHCCDSCWQVACSTGPRPGELDSTCRWRSMTPASFSQGLPAW